jgi:hypothetical protein
MGSITSWIRLEPRCRDDDMQQATRARIYDPLWMLARQWQTAEFQGEDTGTPVLARWRATTTPITRYHAGAIAPNTMLSAPRYDRSALPLEALVERQRSDENSLRLAVESGLHFLRMLDAQATSRSYRADFITSFALEPPSDGERAALDPETRSYWTLMAKRVPDGRRLLAAFRDSTGRRRALPDALGRSTMMRGIRSGSNTPSQSRERSANRKRRSPRRNTTAAISIGTVPISTERSISARRRTTPQPRSCVRSFLRRSVFAARPHSVSGSSRTQASIMAYSQQGPVICRIFCSPNSLRASATTGT